MSLPMILLFSLVTVVILCAIVDRINREREDDE